MASTYPFALKIALLCNIVHKSPLKILYNIAHRYILSSIFILDVTMTECFMTAKFEVKSLVEFTFAHFSKCFNLTTVNQLRRPLPLFLLFSFFSSNF